MGKEHKEDKHKEEKQEYEGTSKIDAAIGNGVTSGAKAFAILGTITAGLGVAANVTDNQNLILATQIAGISTLALTGLSAIGGTVHGATNAGQIREEYEDLVEKNQKLGQENKILKTAVTNTITSALAQGTLVAPERSVGTPM